MFNSKKILPALAIAALISAGYTGSALASPYGDAGYLDYAGSTSYGGVDYTGADASMLDDGNLFEGSIGNVTSGYRAPSSNAHASATVVDRTSSGVVHQYYDVNDPNYNPYNPQATTVHINYSDVYQNAYSVAENSSDTYIAPRDMKDAYNDQFFVGYTYDSDGHRDRPVYEYTDGSNTYRDYFNAAHYEQFAQGTISHNEVLSSEAIGNQIQTDPNAVNHNDIDWGSYATDALGSSGITDYATNYATDYATGAAGGYTSDWLNNIDLSFGSSSANSGSSLSQYLGSSFNSNASNVAQSSLSFGTAVATPVGNMVDTGFTAAGFAPTLNGLGSIQSLTKLSDFYEDFGSADFLNELPGGMGGQISSALNNAAGDIGDAAADMGEQFFSSIGDSFSDFDFGDFSMGDFSMGDLFEGFDLGSLDFVGDFDLGSLTEGLDMGDMFGGMMDGFDLGSILDTSELTSMISDEISGMVGDMLGDFMSDFDIGGAIGSFFG
jgi:hypothetical protein